MNEVEGMDLSESSRLHSPPSACLVSDELNLNVSNNLKSSCAILSTDCKKGALMLLENGDFESCVVSHTSKSASGDADKGIDVIEELKQKALVRNETSVATNDQTKDSTNIDSSKNWKLRVSPILVDGQLENNCSELQLLSHFNRSSCSAVNHHDKNGKNESVYFGFSAGGGEEKPTPIPTVEVSISSCTDDTCQSEKPSEKGGSKSDCLHLSTVSQSENFKLGETITENPESEVEKSDGSDSGLGSELSDEKLESSISQEGAVDSDSKASEIDSGIGCDAEAAQEEQGTTEIDASERCDGSDSGLGSELADERTDSTEPCQLEPSHAKNIAAPLLMDPDSCLEPDEDKSEFNIEAPALDDLKTPTFDEVRSPCLAFDEMKENSEPLRTPQPNLDFPMCSLYEKPAESKISQNEVIKNLTQLPIKSSLKRKSTDTDLEVAPKKKRSISFNTVSVYYFPRAQGFTCVPSQGGSTLGMSSVHSHVQQFTLTEHATEQRRLHRLMLQRLRNERLQPPSDTDDTESDEEPTDDDEGELDLDSYYFLQVEVCFYLQSEMVNL